MKGGLARLAARFNAFQPRERWLIALATLGGIVLLGFSVFIEPAMTLGRKAEQDAAAQRVQLANLQSQLAILQSPDRDPDALARAELDGLRKQLAELAERMRALESALVPPERVPALLEEMVGSRDGLRLLQLRTLPPESLAGNADAKAGKSERSAAGGLYRHGVEVRLEGSYAALTRYLERLEKAPMRLIWGNASLSAEAHPRLVLTLTVYSLSLDKAWLVI